MEKLILIFFISLISCGSSSLKNSNTDYDEKIISAYRYVSEKYDSKIIVSDTLADIDIVNFAEKISKKQSKEMSFVLDSLIKAKEDTGYRKKQYPIKNLVKNTNEKGDLKVFFSTPGENYIMIEVFNTEKNKDYEKLTVFGSSDVYLLFFKDKQVIDEYQIKLDYN